jgi:homoserine dehydrogenase
MSGYRKLVCGMIGGGTVGGGVYNIFMDTKKKSLLAMGIDITIKTICVRDINKERDFHIHPETTITATIDDILNDPEINCVLELCGGTGIAKDIVWRSVESGKHIVTANKALISKFMPELLSLLQANPNVDFGLEAAVGGGIPCISTLRKCALGDEIKQVAGIMNGTTNFILSKMDAEGAAYEDVLNEAQDLGFAEADPTADVEGHDVRSKIAVLAKLAFGVSVPEDKISTSGISSVTADDFAYAKMLKSVVKLLGVAKKIGPNKLSIFVSPVMVPSDDVISTINGATNIIEIYSESMQRTSIVGQGAGRFPTANSVVSDVINIAMGQLGAPFPLEQSWELSSELVGRFYLRFNVIDKLGIIKDIGEVCEKHSVSVFSILQTPIEDTLNIPFCVTTEDTSLASVTKLCSEIATRDWCIKNPMIMPIL